MAIRITGLNSGLDTESLVSALVSAYRTKVEKYTKAQTKLTWKQDIWSSLSSQTYSFRTSLDSMRFSSNYNLKTTSVSNSTKATITASNSAVNGTQSLNITQLATSGYLTGGVLSTSSGSSATTSTTLSSLGFDGTGRISVNGKEIELDGSMSISDAVTALKNAGVNASFDETNQRIFVSSTDSGADNDFTLTALDSGGSSALYALGLSTESSTATAAYESYSAINDDYQAYLTGNNLSEDDYSLANYVQDKLEEYTKASQTVSDAAAAQTYLAKAASYQSALSTISEIEDDASETALTLLNDSSKYVDADENTYTLSDETDDDGNSYYTLDGDENGKKYYLTSKEVEYDTDELDEDGEVVMATKTVSVLTTDPDADAEDGTEVSTADEYLEAAGYDSDTISEYRSAVSTVERIEAELEAEAAKDYEAEENSTYPDYSSLTFVINMPADKIAAAQEALESDTEAAEAVMAENSFYSSYAEDYAAADDEETKAALAEQIASDIEYAVDVLEGNVETAYNSDAVRINGQDAVIYLNGARFTSSTNTFTINGLTINALATTTTEEKIAAGTADEDAVTITTSTDSQGIYDKIKDFLSEYNTLINTMTGYYNADSSSDYDVLTDDEKSEMTDSQIEKWETAAKAGLLRRDSTLSTLMSAMTSVMSKTYEINGKTYSLSTFGIKTLGILNSEENEYYAYHIDGDEDDDTVSGNTDKLLAAIIEDPDAVTEFFQQLSNDLYESLGTKMSSTTLRSYGTFYNDKEMAQEYSDYTETISKWETKLADLEEYYYKKFTAMESALATLQSQSSALASLLGS